MPFHLFHSGHFYEPFSPQQPYVMQNIWRLVISLKKFNDTFSDAC
jgi:hypothetical protein